MHNGKRPLGELMSQLGSIDKACLSRHPSSFGSLRAWQQPSRVLQPLSAGLSVGLDQGAQAITPPPPTAIITLYMSHAHVNSCYHFGIAYCLLLCFSASGRRVREAHILTVRSSICNLPQYIIHVAYVHDCLSSHCLLSSNDP